MNDRDRPEPDAPDDRGAPTPSSSEGVVLPDDDPLRHPATGLVLFGRYRILGKIGEGGMAVIYKAWDTQRGKVATLKGYGPTIFQGESGELQVARIERGELAAHRLHHPRIVAAYDVGRREDTVYLARDYIEGYSLKEHLARNLADRKEGLERGYAKLATEISWLAKVARIIHYAHERGITHRDLKPSNILIGTDDEPYVTDFDLAKPRGQDDLPAPARVPGAELPVTITSTGEVLGTPAYLSPEQADGRVEEVGPPTDIHALGVVLYELLTGQLPFSSQPGARPGIASGASRNVPPTDQVEPPPREKPGKGSSGELKTQETQIAPTRKVTLAHTGSVVDMLHQIIHAPPFPPSHLNPLCPKELEEACLKCLEKEPADRYKTAADLATDLERWLGGMNPDAKDES